MSREHEMKACDFLARLDASPSSSEVRAEVEAWRGADALHEAAWLRASATWDRLGRLAALRPAGAAANPDLFAPPAPKARSRTWPRALAAMLFLAVIGGIAYLAVPPDRSTYTTQVGERRLVRLPDQSSISLNTQSSLQVLYREAERRIEMRDGEGHFRVARDAQRPFIVAARNIEVRAVGTAFVVRLRGDGVEVSVTEGIVAVGSKGGGDNPPDRLVAGQVAMYSADRGVIRDPAPAEIERKLAWEKGMVAFDGEPLSEAIEEFNRYNTHKIVVADPAIAALRVGGYFRADDVAGFVKALQASFELRVQAGGDAVTYLAAAPR